jgi:hypothetical protein
MEADYSVELGPSAPALELPWTDPEGHLHYVELRGASGLTTCNLDRIAEARRFPALRRFLADVNSPPSAWQTVKCDAWADATEAAANPYNAGFMQSSYVDLVLAEDAAGLRDCLEGHQRLAKAMAQALEANESLEALAEVVVRRCYFHRGAKLEESDAGYCLTLFLTGYGTSPDEAAECWEHALKFAAGCLLKLQPPEASA